jgi:hypothetical protein
MTRTNVTKRLRTLSLCTCRRHYPGAASERVLRSFHPDVSVSPIRHTPIEGFSHVVTSMTAPMFRAGAVAGWGLHPPESAAFPRTPEADIGDLQRRVEFRQLHCLVRILGSRHCPLIELADLDWTEARVAADSLKHLVNYHVEYGGYHSREIANIGYVQQGALRNEGGDRDCRAL